MDQLIRAFVTVEDQIPHQLVGLYQQADLFVFPSLYEGFGLPILEALLAGTPVLTTHCGSIPEVGGEVVRYYDHTDTDALARMLLQSIQEKPDSEAMQQHANKFSWERTATETLDCLRS